MRAMKWVLFSLASLAASVFLAREKATTAVLQTDLEQRRLARAELEAQRRERARLLTLQPTSDELAQLHRAVAEQAERRRAIESAARERHETLGLPIGEWIPQTQWRDHGQLTPEATVQTMLWAATGGDTARLGAMLLFDESGRAKLERLYAGLPAHARAMYASGEQLLAAFTAKAIPLGDAQLVWQQQSGPDDAVACVWVNNPAPTLPLETPGKSEPDPKAPPMLPASAKRSQALLTMRRFDDGWRVLVPARAVDKVAQELAGSK